MRLLILTLTFALSIAVLLPQHGYSQNSCSQAIKRKVEEIERTNTPKVGKKYLVQFANDPALHTLRFDGVLERNGQLLVEFSQVEWNKRTTIYRVPEKDLVQWRNPEKKKGVLSNALEFSLDQLSYSFIMADLMFKPFKKLAQNERSVEVVGNWATSRQIGQKLADQLSWFDGMMISMGFLRPDKTRVVVGSRPLLFPSLVGPFSLRFPSFNIWSLPSPRPVIALKPIFWKTSLTKDESILYHERTHSLLHRTYNESAYINRNSALQEALADFTAAHLRNSPEIAPDKNGALRNIETREAQFLGDNSVRNDLLDVKRDSYHENSMIISNILWRMRSTIGAENTSLIYKPLIDSLNSYRDSYDAILKKEGRESEDALQKFAYDVEYTLSIILKQSKTWNRPEIVEALVKDISREFDISFQRIDSLSARVTASDKNYDYVDSLNMFQTIYVTASGLTGFVVQSAFIAWFTGIPIF